MRSQQGFFITLLTVMVTWASPAAAQRAPDNLFRASMVAALAAHGADLASTQHCLGAGRCREMNPFLGRFKNPATFGAVKMGVAAVSLWGMAKVHETHPRWATVLNVLTAAAFTTIAWHNTKVAR